MAQTKVVILGGGFAGLMAAKSLGNTQFDVWLVDKTNHHLFQPLLYQVATAALSPADIAKPIRQILSDYKNITVIMGNVEKIEKEKKCLCFKHGESLSYDFLIVAPGARHSYFGNDSWETFAPGLKTLSDALNIREKILISFEKAERCDSILEAEKYLNFVIVGGGPTGVELAGAIAEIAHETMFTNFRRIDTTKTKIFLIEASPYILPAFDPRLSQKAKKYLENFKVKVITGKKTTSITESGVTVEDLFIPTGNVFWAAGNQASPLLKTLDVPLDKQGRVIVDADLSIPQHPNIFVIGDAACLINKKTEKPFPGLASVAIQQGQYVGCILRKKVDKQDRKPFRYFDKGLMATIGKTKAIGSFGKIRFSGFIAWLAWCFIHILYLIGFTNRIFVLLHWLTSYFTGARGARLIYRSIEE